ncbi:MAG: hypothetical protein WC933_02710 [Candidatus Paceibacterota bacterium]|jgi:hypothetical protein
MKTLYQNQKVWREKYPQKYKAHHIVFCALRANKIKKQNCFICGNKKTEAHHENYDKPLDVVWLCKKHHTEYDAKIRRKNYNGFYPIYT